MKELIRNKYDKLTSSQKKIARYLLEHPEHAALHSSKEIGAATGTSETSVFRFSLALGYSGYSMMQEEIRKALLQQRGGTGPLSRLGESGGYPSDAAADFVRRFAERDAERIVHALTGLDPEAVKQTAERIQSAKSVIVIGLRASFAPAHWLAYMLNIVKGNTTLYRGGSDDANHLLSELDGETLVIAISFPRYMKETCDFVAEARLRRAAVIAFTDSELSPLARLADLSHSVRSSEPLTSSGMPILFSIFGMLIRIISDRDSERVRDRLAEYHQVGQFAYYETEDTGGSHGHG